jgi:N4-gp56 family major capsid protein
MGNTGSISAMRSQLWQRQTLIDAIEEIFFKQNGMMSANRAAPAPIFLKPDFKTKKGSKVTIPLIIKLSGEGRDGDDEQEGNEEEATTYSQDIEINQKRNAVRLQGEMDEQKNEINMRPEARRLLGEWQSEIMTKEFFRKGGGIVAYTFSNTPVAPSSTRVIYGGNATEDADIDSADKMTLSLLFKISNTIMTLTPKIRPIKYKGKSYYLMLIHPNQRYDLMQDDSYLTLQKDAGLRGLGNPLFSGADAIVDNLIIHTHNYVPTFSTWGSTSDQPGARALVMGAQALVLALGKEGKWVEKSFDYDNKWAICTGAIWGVQKTIFNSVDHAIVAIDTYATSL